MATRSYVTLYRRTNQLSIRRWSRVRQLFKVYLKHDPGMALTYFTEKVKFGLLCI